MLTSLKRLATAHSSPLLQRPYSANKSDISYLKTSQAFDILIHSGKPNSVG